MFRSITIPCRENAEKNPPNLGKVEAKEVMYTSDWIYPEYNYLI